MAAWIDVDDVEVLLQTDLTDDEYIGATIDHAQTLAEMEVGDQDAPSKALKSTLVQIVARMWQAGQNARVNPAAMAQDVAGPFSFQSPQAGAAGLGLTNREKAQLKKAVGKGDLWVQPLTRGDTLETAPIANDVLVDEQDPIERLAAAQADMPRPPIR